MSPDPPNRHRLTHDRGISAYPIRVAVLGILVGTATVLPLALLFDFLFSRIWGDAINVFGVPVRTLLIAIFPAAILMGSIGGLLSYLYFRRVHRKMERNQADFLHYWKEVQQLFLDNMPQGVFWKDRDLVYLGCNRLFAKMAGFDSPEEIVGKSDYDLPWPEEETEFFRKVDREVIASDEPMLNIIEPLKDAEGERHWHQVNKVPLHDREGEVIGVLGTYQDITNYKRLEEESHQNEKLRSIGQLAGGIAHDFNNMLSGIMGTADLMSMDLPKDREDLLKQTRTIIETCQRAGQLTQQLLAFSRKAKTQTVLLEANDLVEKVVGILSHSIDRRIGLHQDLSPDPLTLRGDPSQVQSALLNLAVNARDAMLDGGELRISVAEARLDEEYCAAQPFDIEPGPYVEFSVSDTGVGMTPEVREHIFEPFYTTKAPGKGTGLGLSAVYGTVKAHQGCMTVMSEPGRGTVFKFYLPAAEEALPEDTPAEEIFMSGKGRILLVDDEEVVRATAKAILEHSGYEVVSAANGKEGCEKFEQKSGDFDLVILDLVMPVMNGHDAFRRMRAFRSDARILIASGFSLGGDVEDLMRNGAVGFVQKPYRLNALVRTVSDVLAGREVSESFDLD